MEYKKYVETLNEKRSIITNELFIIIVINRRHRLVLLSFLPSLSLSLWFPFHLSLSLFLSSEKNLLLLYPRSLARARETVHGSSLSEQQVCALKRNVHLYHRLLSITSLYAIHCYMRYIYRTYMYVHVYRIHVN